MAETKKFELFDIAIDNITMDEAIDIIISHTGNGETTTELNFVNAHCMNVSYTDEEYRKILQGSTAVFPDGSGIRMAAEMFGTPIADNVNGTDMFPLLCRRCSEEGKKIYLLGASPGTAAKVQDWVAAEIAPGIICGTHDGFFTEEDVPAMLDEIREAGTDILLVGMGVPKQEKWIHGHLEALPVPVAMGVGGLFDYFSGNIARAPLFMRKLGIEWVWRLMKEPRRMWRRYIVGNVLFTRRVKRAVKMSKR